MLCANRGATLCRQPNCQQPVIATQLPASSANSSAACAHATALGDGHIVIDGRDIVKLVKAVDDFIVELLVLRRALDG